MVGRAAEEAASGAEFSTGSLRSASTTGASGEAPSVSVGQSSVQPLPLPEPLPSSPATPEQRGESEPVSRVHHAISPGFFFFPPPYFTLPLRSLHKTAKTS